MVVAAQNSILLISEGFLIIFFIYSLLFINSCIELLNNDTAAGAALLINVTG